MAEEWIKQAASEIVAYFAPNGAPRDEDEARLMKSLTDSERDAVETIIKRRMPKK